MLAWSLFAYNSRNMGEYGLDTLIKFFLFKADSNFILDKIKVPVYEVNVKCDLIIRNSHIFWKSRS